MNDINLTKNILLDKTCETCGRLKVMKKLVLCTKGPNDKTTILINSCEKWIKRINPLDLSEINNLLKHLTITLGIPKGYLSGK